MRPFLEELPPRYVVVGSDRYDSDRDAQYLYFNRLLGPEYAGQWLDDLEQTINDLTEFPGPLSHARNDDASDHYHHEVRRLLYYGPTRRRGVPVRILFTLLPPDPADPTEQAETVIFLLRLLHGSQQLLVDDLHEETPQE